MIRQEYLDYVAGFSKLNPYELHHMCEIIHVQMEKLLFDRHGKRSEDVQFSVPEFKDAITKGMRFLYVELANQKKLEFDMQLEQAKRMAFATEEISDQDIADHLKNYSKKGAFHQDAA